MPPSLEEVQKRTDARSYDVAAAAFDDLTERFAEPIADRILTLARLQNADRVLDIGCGTGLLALRAGRRASDGRVTGIDHSAGMLEQATAKALQLGLGQRVEFRQMDAEQLELTDQSFDVVVSLFALLHIPDPLAALREAYRVLRPGGRLIIGVGGGPPLTSWAGLASASQTLRSRLAIALGKEVAAPNFLRSLMDEQGLKLRVRAHAAPTLTVAQLLGEAGFRNVRATWTGRIVSLSPEDFWGVQATFGSAERVALGDLAASRVEALKAEFHRRCKAVQENGGRLTYRQGARIYTAVRA